jgi:hypothetical protein
VLPVSFPGLPAHRALPLLGHEQDAHSLACSSKLDYRTATRSRHPSPASCPPACQPSSSSRQHVSLSCSPRLISVQPNLLASTLFGVSLKPSASLAVLLLPRPSSQAQLPRTKRSASSVVKTKPTLVSHESPPGGALTSPPACTCSFLAPLQPTRCGATLQSLPGHRIGLWSQALCP